jgi:protein-L-isoaspartate(D-aspartate) O-methyltransferase
MGGRFATTHLPGGSAALLAGAAFPRAAQANVPTPYSADLQPPTTSREAFIKWAVENRGENPRILAARWDRYVFLRANNDFINARNGRAFLLTPRDEFVLNRDIGRAYERDFHDIGWGVTISGPLVVSRMTSTIDVQMGEKVLEIGTGSGNQSAYLSNLTDKVWTIEIIKPLAERTRGIYDDLIGRGYTEYKSINTKNADGYYGWEEAAPFDKIIVICGIDHIPPPLLSQLRPRHHCDSGRSGGSARHLEGSEAAGRRRFYQGCTRERVQQGRPVRRVYQARRRGGQGHS